MKRRDIALTGVPRGGTTLACQLLGECENTVSLFEPMDVTQVPFDDDGALEAISAFYTEMRLRLRHDGKGVSKHRGGAVPDNPFDQSRTPGALRRDRTERGLIELGRQPEDFTLVIKHNALFSGLLPRLADHLPVLAIVRNPLAVLASWNTVDLPVGHGRLPAGERLDARLRARLDDTDDKIERQCVILDWFFSRFHEHLTPECVLRYEDVVATQGAVLRRAADLRGPPRDDLKTRNVSPVYSGSHIARLADGLRYARSVGQSSWSRWYSDADIQSLAIRLAAGTVQ